MGPLTALDVTVLLIIGLASVLGFMRGFVSEVMSLIAWVVAIFAVKLFHGVVTVMLTGFVGTEAGAGVLAVALIFGIVFLITRSLGRRMGRSTRGSLLGPFDRLLGLGFGALKGLIASSLMFLLMSLSYDVLHGAHAPRPAWMTTSRTYPLLRASSAAVVNFVEKQRNG